MPARKRRCTGGSGIGDTEKQLLGMTLAVYTTVYPGVEPYLADWYRSLRRQTDQDFQLWMGFDSLSIDQVDDILGCEPQANWVKAPAGATVSQVRQQALSRIVELCSAVVLVDSDDVLHPSRVAAARARLSDSELAGCALRLVDQQGNDLSVNFGVVEDVDPETVFPRSNVFGFSNSAFRSDLLSRCLPIPAEAVLVDWFLSTRAWLMGATMSFDHVPRMDYRQYPGNTARVGYPFSKDRVASDTTLVLQHLRLLLACPATNDITARTLALEKVLAEVEEFQEQIVLEPLQLERYVRAFNALHPPTLWWSCVAHPALSHMWTERKCYV